MVFVVEVGLKGALFAWIRLVGRVIFGISHLAGCYYRIYLCCCCCWWYFFKFFVKLFSYVRVFEFSFSKIVPSLKYQSIYFRPMGISL